MIRKDRLLLASLLGGMLSLDNNVLIVDDKNKEITLLPGSLTDLDRKNLELAQQKRDRRLKKKQNECNHNERSNK